MLWFGVEWARCLVDGTGMQLSSMVTDTGGRGDFVMARKVLDAMEAEGAAAVQMIRDAAEAGKAQRGGRGGQGAVSARPGAGEAGHRLDVTG